MYNNNGSAFWTGGNYASDGEKSYRGESDDGTPQSPSGDLGAILETTSTVHVMMMYLEEEKRRRRPTPAAPAARRRRRTSTTTTSAH